MNLRPLRNWLLGGGTLLSAACLLAVEFPARPMKEPRTLMAAMAKLTSDTEGGGTALLGCLPILLAASLPPLLWIELTVARRPLSRRMRALLLAQGAAGLLGVALAALYMSLTLMHFGFSVDSDPESAGFYVILAVLAIFALGSVLLGLYRRAIPANDSPAAARAPRSRSV